MVRGGSHASGERETRPSFLRAARRADPLQLGNGRHGSVHLEKQCVDTYTRPDKKQAILVDPACTGQKGEIILPRFPLTAYVAEERDHRSPTYIPLITPHVCGQRQPQ